MTRTFSYTFDPSAACPVGSNTVELSVDEIENAGLVEVLQTPGAAFGSWAILDSLLEPTGDGSPFIFKEALGQAREVKVALSGLFGRFVARAYLERYFNLKHFAHLGRRIIRLDGRRRVSIKRKRNRRGDLPDWLASDASLSTLVIAEAKGCHEASGPDQTLKRAWAQADRVDVVTRGERRAKVKRIAIATRWGMTTGGPHDPIMAVQDPEEIGDMTHDEMEAAFVGISRLHAANLLRGVGQEGLSKALRALTDSQTLQAGAEMQRLARGVLDTANVQPPLHSQSDAHVEQLIGGWLTRAGQIGEAHLPPSDVQVLRRLDLKPVFVGLEPQLLRGVIDGDLEQIRSRARERIFTGPTRTNGSGIWMLWPTEAGG